MKLYFGLNSFYFTEQTDSFYILKETKELLKFVAELKTKICIQQI
jgi:hypothetical protein